MPVPCSRCARYGQECTIDSTSGRCGACTLAHKPCDLRVSWSDFKKLAQARRNCIRQLETAEEALAEVELDVEQAISAALKRLSAARHHVRMQRKKVAEAEDNEDNAYQRELSSVEVLENAERPPCGKSVQPIDMQEPGEDDGTNVDGSPATAMMMSQAGQSTEPVFQILHPVLALEIPAASNTFSTLFPEFEATDMSWMLTEDLQDQFDATIGEYTATMTSNTDSLTTSGELLLENEAPNQRLRTMSAQACLQHNLSNQARASVAESHDL